MKKNLVMLAILDGYGLSDEIEGNAIFAANTPTMDYLTKNYPYTQLSASGEAVGLPDGQMGNSEVGHLNLGAGRIVYQSLTKFNIAVRDDTLIHTQAIQKAIKNAIDQNGKLHIMGLMSDGGVHSHITHILYLMEKAVEAGVKKVVIHPYLDGRDVPPTSAATYFKQLDEKMKQIGSVQIGVVSGRYYAMDRDKNWSRLQLAYDALVYGEGPNKGLFEGLSESYQKEIVDEFVLPYIVNKDTQIEDGDSVIFANFRPDRAIELSTALTNPTASGLHKSKVFKNLTFVGFMPYADSVKGDYVFDLQILENTFGEVVSAENKTQLRIAETEKYAHVTYFFDGGVDKELAGADRILVKSPKVPTFDLKPEMSAYEVCEKAVEAIQSEKYDTIILNFANCDMVGHTTVFDATVKAVEVVDECLGKLYQEVEKIGGTILVIADHGNADKLLDEFGKPFSAHTTNPVPCIVTKKGVTLRDGGNLGDVIPTMFELMNIEQPVEMTGKSLILK